MAVIGMHGADVWRLISNAEKDLQSAVRNLTELRAYLAAMNMPDGAKYVTCPECGLDLRGGELRLAEHRYVVHDVPLPEVVE